MEAAKKQLEIESDKRSQLEKTFSTQKAETAKLKDLNVKLERDLAKALNDIQEKEWELKQMESKRDKAIVEHKHVYEAAKKMTDAQLAEAQLELQKNAVYIRSLEKAKARLLNETEDLTRATEHERAELRAKEKSARQQEERVIRATMEHEKGRIAKDSAELKVHHLQSELQGALRQVAELTERAEIVQRSRDKLQDSLDRQEEELASTASSAAQSEVRKVIETYKAKEREYQERLEAAEIARAKAARGEASGMERAVFRISLFNKILQLGDLFRN